MRINPFTFRPEDVTIDTTHPELLFLARESSNDIRTLRRRLAAEAEEFEQAGLGDKVFFRQLLSKDQYWQYLWEMRLGLFLRQQDENVQRNGDYPDFYIKRSPKDILVEATSISRGMREGKSYLGDRRRAVGQILEDGTIQLTDDAIYRPDHEREAVRIHDRILEKVGNHCSRLEKEESFADKPFIVALDIADIDDQFHNAMAALYFYGLNDTCSATVSTYSFPMISKIDSVPVPEPANRSVCVGWLRKYPIISAIIIGRAWRYQAFDDWNNRSSVFIIENPWAKVPVCANFLPGLRRENYVARWLETGALFSAKSLSVLPSEYRNPERFRQREFSRKDNRYFQLIPLEGTLR